MAFVNEKYGPRLIDRWTVDHERNIELTKHGSGGTEQNQIFELKYKDKKVTFIAKWEKKTEGDIFLYFNWILDDIRIPASLKDETGAILEIIKEALNAHGFFFERDIIQKLDVTITQNAVHYYPA